jgi:hypothetical protein
MLEPTDRNAERMGEVARGYAFGTAGRGAVLLSEDEGESWRPIAEDLPALRQLAVVAA